MHYKICEICGIRSGRVLNEKRIFMARFPTNKERCKQWVKLTGKEDLAYIPIEKLHQLKYICGKHFLPQDFNEKKTQLTRNAIPSVSLTAEPLSDEILMEFPLHILEKSTSTAEKTAVRNSKIQKPKLVLVPTVNYKDHDYCLPCIVKPEPITPSTTNILQTSYRPEISTTTAPLKEENSQTETKKLLNKLKKRNLELKKLRKRVRAIDNIQSPILRSLIESEVKNQNRKSKGKRWTDLNKTIALAIYKESPKAYKYISQLLPLPSVRTLQTVLENMKTEPTFNISIMDDCVDVPGVGTVVELSYM